MKTRIIETKAGKFLPQYRYRYPHFYSFKWKYGWRTFTVDQAQYDYGDRSWAYANFNNIEDAAKFLADLKKPKYKVVYES